MEIMVTLIVVFVILTGFALRYRIKLILFFSRMSNGQFSYKYFLLLNKFFFEKKYAEAIKFEPLYFISSLVNRKYKHEYKTDEKIQFAGRNFGEVNSSVYSELGKPDYLTVPEEKVSGMSLVCIGFKKNAYNYESTLLYFFAGNLFIFGQYMFKREKQKVDVGELIAKLEEKYGFKSNSGKTDDFILYDQEGAGIHFHDDGFSVILTFFNPNIAFLNKNLPSQKGKGKPSSDADQAENQGLTF